MPLAITETDKPVHIAIIGGGFCGVLTAIHLLRDNRLHLHIHLINKGSALAKGVAYDPHTASLLLNVPNGKMSAFPDDPDHFMRWLSGTFLADGPDKDKLATAFSPRQHYGQYLTQLWNTALHEHDANKRVTLYNDTADDIITDGGLVHIQLQNHAALTADITILATGNAQPRLPTGIDPSLTKSKYYFANPWKKDCIEGLDAENDILIIGNGLTMADTVVGLMEKGFGQTIHTISPHGYRLNACAEDIIPYTAFSFAGIAAHEMELYNLFKTFNKHRKLALKLNQSVYPLIDSLRPHIQKIWMGFGLREKQQFIKYLKPFWEKVRHRLPVQMHRQLNAMAAKGKLITHKGYIVSIEEQGDKIDVTLNTNGQLKSFKVQRVINCIGPETDINKPGNKLLNNLAKKGLIAQGPCGMGINACAEDGSVISLGTTTKQAHQPNLYVIGSNLKGMLWESTAVPELRVQAKKLAQQILSGIYARQAQAVEQG